MAITRFFKLLWWRTPSARVMRHVVSVDGAAESVVSANAQSLELVGVGDRFGRGS